MHCLPNTNRGWVFLCSIAVLAPVFVCAAPAAPGPGFHVQKAQVRLEDGVYLLDALINFGFSDESIEAMENGVSLTVLLDIEVLKKNPLWDNTVLEHQSRFRIGVHALSKRYVVRELETGETRTFRAVDEMAAALGMITDLPLFDENLLDAESSYSARVRARLDIEALPSPLRPLAYISPEWRLGGDWYEWPLTR